MTDNPRQVRVVFRKQVSDGNYGSESAEATLEWWSEVGDDGEADATTAETMLKDARALVHAELAHSPNPRVRASLQLPLPADTDDLPL